MSPLLPRPLPLAGLAWLTGLRRVPENTVVTKHRFGRFVGALGPGWHWTWPGLDTLGSPVCLIGHHLDIAANEDTHAELYYQILDPARAGEALDRVDALVSDQARETLATLRQQPDPGRPLAETLKAELNQRIARLGLRVIRCSLHPA